MKEVPIVGRCILFILKFWICFMPEWISWYKMNLSRSSSWNAESLLLSEKSPIIYIKR